MAFHYLTNLPLNQVREEYRKALREAGFGAGTEMISVQEANGRVTAEAVYAHICAPHYPASAMDGIAVVAGTTYGAGETTPVTLRKNQFTVVDTGDPVPEGYDAVVMIEEVVYQENGDARLYAPAVPWQHIRQIGEDICAGEMILSSNMRVSPSAIGAMLAGGVQNIKVLCQPVVGIVPTGDEIVAPTDHPEAGEIIEFNSSIFSAMLKEWRAVPRVYPIVRDDLEEIENAVKTALEECDIVLLNAGSSAGREDFAAQAIGRLGEITCHGIAMKPGKPAILGHRENKPVLGVPGYPVSGILVLEEVLRPLIDDWYHMEPAMREYQEAVLTRPVVSGLKYQEFVRVRMGKVGGKIMASPLNRGSGVVTSFMKADGILEVPQGVEGYEAGQTVQVRLLRPAEELDRTLVAIGSHDPLLDELADLFHRANPAFSMNSTHVGSMGGIMAVRRGKAHIAGVHLLDEHDGSYNTAFVQRYFPSGGVRLVECVGRVQGLMLRHDQSKKIQGISDLVEPGLRYVNRQKGSGTRILIDYLCKKEGIDTAAIYGYDREEFTHTSVAAQIAMETADVGMGIYSAAQIYGLDFLPICTEQYDLLIPDSAWDSFAVQRFLEVLRSAEFEQRLAALGGYQVCSPGRVRQHF